MTLQQAPQIRLIQTTNQVLAEKIQTSINTSIPLWKNQVTIALTLLKQKKAVTAQRAVADTTNEYLSQIQICCSKIRLRRLRKMNVEL
nr:toxic anion resistance protein [Weissella fangxianensis]